MAEYIDRDLALSFPFANGEYDREHADPHFINGCETYREWLEQLPADDVAEVRHGRWLPVKGYEGVLYRCSECEDKLCKHTTTRTNYCPDCGARMDESEVSDDG